MPFIDDDDFPEPANTQKSPKSEKRIALVIGNGAYQHTSPLTNPLNDARAITKKLESLGFTVFSGFDLSYRQLGKQVVDFENAVRGADIALLFYAGHGLQVHGKNYLVPVDAKIESIGELKFNTILFDDILEPMTRLARASLVFLDACRDNPLARNVARSLGQRSVSGGLAKIEATSGSFISFATAPDQVAYDGKGSNSPYTAAFLKHIEKPGRSLSNMMIHVRNDVLKETGDKQEPWDQSSLRFEFYFIPEVPKQAVPQPSGSVHSEAAAAWQPLEHSTNIALLTAFKTRYDGTVYADCAQARIEKLRKLDRQAKAETEAKRLAEEKARQAEEQKLANALKADNEAFKVAEKTNSVEGYKVYLSNFSKGYHVGKAKAAIQKLKPFPLKKVMGGVSVIALVVAGYFGSQSWLYNRSVTTILTNSSYIPETVPIPSGTFSMGCVSGKECNNNEKPVHRVTVNKFYMSKYETTFAQWDACVQDGGCTHKPEDEGWGRDNRPVINVSWDDASQYAKWLSGKTGEIWRLPTEAEWEYAARGDKNGRNKTQYSWGNSLGNNKANCWSCGETYPKKTTPVGSFLKNQFGLHDMYGNVREWIFDRYDRNYYKNSPVRNPENKKYGSGRVIRGGNWNDGAANLRSADRRRGNPDYRNNDQGFRLVREPLVKHDKLSDIPETTLLLGGTFMMGCGSILSCESDEKPAHRVMLSKFYMSKYETTFVQWDACVKDGGCKHNPSSEGWGRNKRPVINVSWDDANQYAKWLSDKTGETWRLPTEAEWEYAAQAGSQTKYSWGNSIGRNKANCDGCGSRWDNKKTAPAGQFLANKFGLYDMHGNVWEWVSDWYDSDYYKNSPIRNPRGAKSGSLRVIRSGSWRYNTESLRSANRDGDSPVVHNHNIGFRLVREPLVKHDKLSDIPETTLLPGGTFMMGCGSILSCESDEKPAHRVMLSKFYMSKYETTFVQWDACVKDGGCKHNPSSEGWGRNKRPVINVSWDDANQYAKWLSDKTGETWRLPTEAEWEYAAQAGSQTKYSWGNSIGRNKANCDGCGSRWDNKKTAPVGQFLANKFGLYDMHGNVMEWVSDWYDSDYYKYSPLRNPKDAKLGSLRVSRGGSWFNYAKYLRSASRNRNSPSTRGSSLGFRLVRQSL